MQRDLTVALSMLDLPDFVLVWGTGAGTNSSVPENISLMTKQQLEAFVCMLGYGSVELIRDVHAGQRHDERTFFVYLAMASKDAHVSCRMCPPKRSRPHCLQALCNWTMKAGGIGLDGSMHPARRYSTASLA